VFKGVMASLLIVCCSTACMRPGRPSPAAPARVTPSTPAAASTVPPATEITSLAEARRASHRPIHKGFAELATGVYIREDDDLVVNTSNPLVLRRTYNSLDGHSRQFGFDATHSGEWWIYGDGDPRIPWGDLILPNGSRIHFTRISAGETQEGAVLRHDGGPSDFNGALLSWNGSKWEMRFRDGSLAIFRDCQHKHETCSLVERRDPEDHRIVYVRDASGTLLAMESENQRIAFEYDDHKRIVRAYTAGREVAYTYDEGGRLIRATGPYDITRTYEYDEHNKLVGIREPARILRNWFDDGGRWVRQVVKSSEDDADPYVATARYVVENGSIVQSFFDEGDGLEIDRYNAQHYLTSETFDADGPHPISFSYNLDPVTNLMNKATLSCVGPAGAVTRAVEFPAGRTKAAKQALIRQHCVRRETVR
jgi:YD repeat-containing protein